MLAWSLKKLFPGRKVPTRSSSYDEFVVPSSGQEGPYGGFLEVSTPIMSLTFQELQEITNDFSPERKVGRAPYGVVYKVGLIMGTFGFSLQSFFDSQILSVITQIISYLYPVYSHRLDL